MNNSLNEQSLPKQQADSPLNDSLFSRTVRSHAASFLALALTILPREESSAQSDNREIGRAQEFSPTPSLASTISREKSLPDAVAWFSNFATQKENLRQVDQAIAQHFETERANLPLSGGTLFQVRVARAKYPANSLEVQKQVFDVRQIGSAATPVEAALQPQTGSYYRPGPAPYQTERSEDHAYFWATRVGITKISSELLEGALIARREQSENPMKPCMLPIASAELERRRVPSAEESRQHILSAPGLWSPYASKYKSATAATNSASSSPQSPQEVARFVESALHTDATRYANSLRLVEVAAERHAQHQNSSPEFDASREQLQQASRRADEDRRTFFASLGAAYSVMNQFAPEAAAVFARAVDCHENLTQFLSTKKLADALTSFSSVVSLAGLIMGGMADPDAQRHAQVMQALGGIDQRIQTLQATSARFQYRTEDQLGLVRTALGEISYDLAKLQQQTSLIESELLESRVQMAQGLALLEYQIDAVRSSVQQAALQSDLHFKALYTKQFEDLLSEGLAFEALHGMKSHAERQEIAESLLARMFVQIASAVRNPEFVGNSPAQRMLKVSQLGDEILRVDRDIMRLPGLLHHLAMVSAPSELRSASMWCEGVRSLLQLPLDGGWPSSLPRLNSKQARALIEVGTEIDQNARRLLLQGYPQALALYRHHFRELLNEIDGITAPAAQAYRSAKVPHGFDLAQGPEQAGSFLNKTNVLAQFFTGDPITAITPEAIAYSGALGGSREVSAMTITKDRKRRGFKAPQIPVIGFFENGQSTINPGQLSVQTALDRELAVVPALFAALPDVVAAYAFATSGEQRFQLGHELRAPAARLTNELGSVGIYLKEPYVGLSGNHGLQSLWRGKFEAVGIDKLQVSPNFRVRLVNPLIPTGVAELVIQHDYPLVLAEGTWKSQAMVNAKVKEGHHQHTSGSWEPVVQSYVRLDSFNASFAEEWRRSQSVASVLLAAVRDEIQTKLTSAQLQEVQRIEVQDTPTRSCSYIVFGPAEKRLINGNISIANNHKTYPERRAGDTAAYKITLTSLLGPDERARLQAAQSEFLEGKRVAVRDALAEALSNENSILAQRAASLEGARTLLQALVLYGANDCLQRDPVLRNALFGNDALPGSIELLARVRASPNHLQARTSLESLGEERIQASERAFHSLLQNKQLLAATGIRGVKDLLRLLEAHAAQIDKQRGL